MSIENLIIPGVTTGFTAIGVLCFSWVGILRQTNRLLKEQNEELRSQNAELKQEKDNLAQKHTENKLEIAELRGKIDNLTVIPIGKIAKSLEALNRSNTKILASLQDSALILAKNTTTAAVHVEEVKTDLKHSK